MSLDKVRTSLPDEFEQYKIDGHFVVILPVKVDFTQLFLPILGISVILRSLGKIIGQALPV